MKYARMRLVPCTLIQFGALLRDLWICKVRPALGAHVEEDHTRLSAFRLVLVEHGAVSGSGRVWSKQSQSHSEQAVQW